MTYLEKLSFYDGGNLSANLLSSIPPERGIEFN